MGAVGHGLLQVGVEAGHALVLRHQFQGGGVFSRHVEHVGHHVQLLVEVKIAQANFHREVGAVPALAAQYAVLAHAAHLRAGVEAFAQLLVVPAGGVGHQHLDALAQQLGRRVAELLLGQLVGRHDVAQLVADDDADGGVRDHRFEAPHAVGQRALGLLQAAPLGEVDEEKRAGAVQVMRQFEVGAEGLAGVAPDVGFHGVVAFAPGLVAQGLPLRAGPGRRAQRVVGVGQEHVFGGVAQQAHPRRVYLRKPAQGRVVNPEKFLGLAVEQLGEDAGGRAGEHKERSR